MKGVIYIVLGLFIAIVVGISIILLVGSGLPRAHVISRSVRIKSRPDEVYSVIRDFASAPAWRTGIESVELLEKTEDGHVRFREKGSNDTVDYEVVADEPGRLITVRILNQDLGYGGSWTYRLTALAEGGTELAITEDGEVSNPFFRFVGYYFLGYDFTIKKYLADISARVV